MIQSFGEESSTLLLIFYLFLGFCGFFLLILLLSIILITLSEYDQILGNIITEDQEVSNTYEKYEVQKDIENCDTIMKIPNEVLNKLKQTKMIYCELFQTSLNFQFHYFPSMYSEQCSLIMTLFVLNKIIDFDSEKYDHSILEDKKKCE